MNLEKLGSSILTMLGRLAHFYNPLVSAELERIHNTVGKRIRDAVRMLRRSGHAIGSSPVGNSKGYFIAKTKLELQPTIDDLKSRRDSLSITIQALEKTCERLPD